MNEENIEFHDLAQEGSDDSAEGSIAFHIASFVMTEFGPGFAIIGSPRFSLTENGIKYPDEIGVLMDSSLTKSELASILSTLVTQLNGDTEKVEAFLREALGND